MFPQSSVTPGEQALRLKKLLQMRVYVTPSILPPRSRLTRQHEVRGFAGTSSPLTDSNRRPPPYHRATRREPRALPGSRGHESRARRGNRPRASDRLCPPVPVLVFPQCSLGAPTGGTRIAALRSGRRRASTTNDRHVGRAPDCVTALGEPRQAVIGERFPHGGIGYELPHRGTHARIAVKRPHPYADRLGVTGVRPEDRRSTVAAEPFLTAALRRLPPSQLLLTRDDPEGARSRMCLRRCRSTGSSLTSFAVAVARPNQRFGDFVPNRPAVTAAREREFRLRSVKQHRDSVGEDSGRSVRGTAPAGGARARAGSTRAVVAGGACMHGLSLRDEPTDRFLNALDARHR
jgi:hypothetical protein